MKRLEYKSGTSSKTRSAAAKVNDTKVSKKENKNLKVNYKKSNSKKSKKKNIKKTVIISLFFVICFIAIFAYLLFTLDSFNILNIELSGNTKYTNEELIQKSGITVGENIFMRIIKGTNITSNEMPYIKSAKMHLELPDKLKLKITERESLYFAFDKEKNVYYKIDKEGYILEQSDISQKATNEILTYGFVFDDEVIFGSIIKDIDLAKITIFENINNAFLKSGINGDITKVTFDNSLTTITLNDKLNVILPNDTDISYNMNFLKGIIEKIGEDSVGVIDMTKNNPTFSNF